MNGDSEEKTKGKAVGFSNSKRLEREKKRIQQARPGKRNQ